MAESELEGKIDELVSSYTLSLPLLRSWITGSRADVSLYLCYFSWRNRRLYWDLNAKWTHLLENICCGETEADIGLHTSNLLSVFRQSHVSLTYKFTWENLIIITAQYNQGKEEEGEGLDRKYAGWFMLLFLLRSCSCYCQCSWVFCHGAARLWRGGTSLAMDE